MKYATHVHHYSMRAGSEALADMVEAFDRFDARPLNGEDARIELINAFHLAVENINRKNFGHAHDGFVVETDCATLQCTELRVMGVAKLKIFQLKP